MRRCIDHAGALASAVLLAACSASPPPPQPAKPITQDEVRAALAKAASLDAPRLVQVEDGVLDLSRVPLGDGAAAVLQKLDLAGVRELDLSETGITPTAVRGLCSAVGLQSVERLVIDCHGESDEAPPAFTESAVAIAACRGLYGLQQLSIMMCSIGDLGADAIAKAQWSGLAKLDLPGNEIGPEGAQAIARAASLGKLGRLRLEHNAIGDQGAVALVEADVLARAETNLSNNRLGDATVRAILLTEKVRALEMRDNELSQEVVVALAERFGGAVEVD